MAIQKGSWATDDAGLARAMVDSEETSCDELGITEAQSENLFSAMISQGPLVSETMTAKHRQCDLLFSKAEAFIVRDDWEQGRPAFDHFRNAMKHHYLMEEEVLFPSLEQRRGQTRGLTRGLTRVMRMEHERMHQLLSDMEEALAREDRDQYLGFAKALMVTIQQHNILSQENCDSSSNRELEPTAAMVFPCVTV